MIYFDVALKNPFKTDRDQVSRCWHGKVTRNKAWEAEIHSHPGLLIKVGFHWTLRADHACIRATVGLCSREAVFSIYDVRHWDVAKNAYESFITAD